MDIISIFIAVYQCRSQPSSDASECRETETVGYSAPNETSVSHPPLKAQGSSRNRGRENGKSQRLQRSPAKQCFPDMTGTFSIRTHKG